jgi:allantoate deiminase
MEIEPNAGNVIAGKVYASLDVRHALDEVRHQAAELMLNRAKQIAAGRGLSFEWEQHLDQPAVAMDPTLVNKLEQAVKSAGYPVYHMPSGAGHDAMIMAQKIPSAMLFLRSPGGVSHHPDENVLVEDVQAALNAGMRFLEQWETRLD